MLRSSCIAFMICLVIFSLQGQVKVKLPEYERLYRSALRLYVSENANESTDSMALGQFRKSIQLIQAGNIHSPMLADAYLKCGILLMTKMEWDSAMQNLRGGLASLDRLNQLPDSLYFQPNLYLGSIQYELNRPDSALYFYKKAEAIHDRYNNLEASERLFNKLGVLYYETGDYQKSINYFDKAVSIISAQDPVDPYFLVNYKNNIAAALQKLGRYAEAIDIFRGLLRYGISTDQLLHNLGNACIEAGNHAGAMVYLRQIREKDMAAYNSMSKAFIQAKRPDSARVFLEKAMDMANAGGSAVKAIDQGVAWKNAGDIYMLDGRPEMAAGQYQQAIIRFYPQFSDTSVGSNPNHFPGLLNFSLLFDALVSKAGTLREIASRSKSPDSWQQSFRAYESAISLAGHIERTYFSDDARLFLKSRVGPAIQDAVDAALKLYALTGDGKMLDQAFTLAENQKASVLQAGIKNLELSGMPGIPAALLRDEKNYKTLITRLSIRASGETDSTVVTGIRKKILDLELALAGVQEKLDENPEFHRLRSGYVSVGLDSLEKNVIRTNTALLSYYYTRDRLICFYVTDEETGVSETVLDSSLFIEIAKLRNELETPEASNRKILEGRGAALYRMLVKPVREKLHGKGKLVIIPFNEIGYIPFELLQDEQGGKMLLDEFDISYNYSANFIPESTAPVNGEYSVLAFAPFTGDRNSDLELPVLSSSAEEIEGLHGKILKGALATKMQFESYSGQYPVVHLATHAIANDADPASSYIGFYGKRGNADTLHRLYEQEILNLDMHEAKLVILSACETGNGKLVNGEGIISLSRAFSYAGCKSVVASLWKADDMATAFITRRFHGYLEKGYERDHALRQAKMDYINSSDIDGRHKSPAYWAHLVLIGEAGPLVKGSSLKVSMIILIVFLVLLGFLYGYKKVNRAKPPARFT